MSIFLIPPSFNDSHPAEHKLTMPTIPKKVTERFSKAVPKFQKVLQLAKDRDVNESDTVAILMDILSDVFGYDKYLEVTSEVAIRGTYCDLALRVDDKIQFLIEVKAIGIELKESHIKQACDYGANHGVRWVMLTNGITWKVYRIRFEQPIAFDLVYTFDFLSLNIKREKDRELLIPLAKEGLSKNHREEFFEKVQTINRHIIGNLILSQPVLTVLRRELKKLADGVKVDLSEIEEITKTQVLKRDIIEGEEATEAQDRTRKFYRKAKAPKKKPELKKIIDPQAPMPPTTPNCSPNTQTD